MYGGAELTMEERVLTRGGGSEAHRKEVHTYKKATHMHMGGVM